MREEEIHCGKDFRNRPDTGRVCRIFVQMGRGGKSQTADGGEWIRLFVRWGYALEQEHVRLYDFCLFMKRQMHPCRHFWMRSVYVCATIRIQADRKYGRIVCRSTKENCRSGRRAGKSLRLPREHFMAESSAENLRCNEICRKRMEKFLAESRLEFLKNSGCICLLEC